MGFIKNAAGLLLARRLGRARFGIWGLLLPIAWQNRARIAQVARAARDRVTGSRTVRSSRSRQAA